MARSKRAAKRAVQSTAIVAKPGGPIVGDVMPTAGYGRYRRRVNDRAIDADLGKLNGIFELAAVGQTRQLIDTYKSTYIRDSRLYAVARTRVHAISARPWVLKPPPGMGDDVEAKDIAQRVTTILNEVSGFAKLMATLGYGAVEGFAVAQHQWRTNARGEWVSQPKWIHSNRFAWDMDSLELCKCEPDQDRPPGVPLSSWPGKFVVHSPAAGAADYPWYRGAMRSRIIPSVTKRFGLKWWLKMLERWGQPQLYATIDPDLREGVGDEVDAALRAMGSAWFARFPQGTELKSVDAPVEPQLHSTWIDWHNTEDAIALLGQNLTTEVTSGSFAAAAAHQKVRLDILAADLAELAETIVDQWIRWIVYYNWPGAPVPRLDFVLAPQGDITVQHYQAGLFTADEVRAAMGFDAEPDGRGSRYFVAPPTLGLAPVAASSMDSAPLGGAGADAPLASRTPMKSRSTHPFVHTLSRP